MPTTPPKSALPFQERQAAGRAGRHAAASRCRLPPPPPPAASPCCLPLPPPPAASRRRLPLPGKSVTEGVGTGMGRPRASSSSTGWATTQLGLWGRSGQPSPRSHSGVPGQPPSCTGRQVASRLFSCIWGHFSLFNKTADLLGSACVLYVQPWLI